MEESGTTAREVGALANGDVAEHSVCGHLLEHALGVPPVAPRIPWATASRWFDRALERDRRALEEGFATYVASSSVHRALACSLARPTTTYRVALSLAKVLVPVSVANLELFRGVLRLELHLLPHLRGCEGLFHAWVGFARGLPRVHGGPDALVRAELSSRQGHYEIAVGPSATVTRPTSSSACALFEALAQFPAPTRGAVLAEILSSLEAAPVHDSGVLVLRERLRITRAEARVALRLADGMLIPELARELQMAEATARTHLRNIFRKTGVTRQVELVTLVHRALSGRVQLGSLRHE
ncbi:MAG: helix-turn-helix transcriptional regulator [Polyangiales bacterium]